MSELPFELTFKKYCQGPLDRTMELFVSNETDETRKTFLHAIGNTAILAFSENQKLFDEFIEWLKDARSKIQMKVKNET